MSVPDALIAHGFTLADLHEIARLAVHTIGPMGMDWHERHDIAYSAIAEALYAAEDKPQRGDLVHAGRMAIYEVVREHRHHHGFYKAKTIGTAGGTGSSPAFQRFWTHVGEEPWFDGLVDRLAVVQIWAILSERQREAITALAVLENYRAAAAHLGIKDQTFRSLLGRARKVFLALWHEGETPSKPWGTDRRVGSYATSAEDGSR